LIKSEGSARKNIIIGIFIPFTVLILLISGIVLYALPLIAHYPENLLSFTFILVVLGMIILWVIFIVYGFALFKIVKKSKYVNEGS